MYTRVENHWTKLSADWLEEGGRWLEVSGKGSPCNSDGPAQGRDEESVAPTPEAVWLSSSRFECKERRSLDWSWVVVWQVDVVDHQKERSQGSMIHLVSSLQDIQGSENRHKAWEKVKRTGQARGPRGLCMERNRQDWGRWETRGRKEAVIGRLVWESGQLQRHRAGLDSGVQSKAEWQVWKEPRP